MSKKITTTYCRKCRKYTKHIILGCTQGMGIRILQAILTLGATESYGNNYDCICTNCGNTKVINR